jgi:outer membrane protein assembly factor BamB
MLVRFCLRGAALVALLSAPAFAGEAWTSFQNAGHLDLKDTITSGEGSPFGTQLWTAKIPGYGQSSPVLWKNHVYVTSIEGPNRDTYHVAAYDIGDGKPLWDRTFKNPSPVESTSYISRASSTPAVDEKGLICFLEGGIVLALSHDGDARWQRDLVAEFGPIDSRHGVSASIEQQKDRVFVWVERTTDPYVLAVDKTSGKDVWKVPGVGGTSWSSPRLVPVDGGEHLVLSAIGSLTGLDPQTGKKLWKLEGVVGNSTPTPMPLGRGRFLIGATDGRGEMTSAGKPAESNGVVAIRKGDDGKWTADYVWRSKRATSSFGSPMAAGGNAYIVNRTGVLYCLDLETGEERYVERTPESVWCTPVADDHAVVLFGKGGTITVVAKGPEFKVLGSMKLWTDEPPMEPAPPPRPMGEGRGGPPGPPTGPTLYGVALADGKLFARRGETLFCLKYGVDGERGASAP